MKRAGIALLVMAYAVLLYTTLAGPAYARGHPQLDRAMLAAYAAPWPVTLAGALAIQGLVLTLVPIRRGETWAMWLLGATLLLLLATRLATDPRCLVVLDPHQHGCHTFMIAMVLGLAGLLLAATGGKHHTGP